MSDVVISELVKTSTYKSVRDGQYLGMDMAVKTLRECKDVVALENQTWDSAIAVLELMMAKLSASPAPATEAAS